MQTMMDRSEKLRVVKAEVDAYVGGKTREEADEGCRLKRDSRLPPEECMEPVESPLQRTELLVGSVEGNEKTVQSLVRKLEDMEKDKTESHDKVARISLDLIQKGSCVMALTYYVECLKECSQKLERENENLLVAKQEFSFFPINHHHPQRTGKETKLLVEVFEDQYVCIGLEMASMFR